MKNVTFSLESLARQKNITLRFESAEDEIMIMYEADKLEKIMSNLLSNAFKFTPEGGSVSVAVAVGSSKESKTAYHADGQGCRKR